VRTSKRAGDGNKAEISEVTTSYVSRWHIRRRPPRFFGAKILEKTLVNQAERGVSEKEASTQLEKGKSYSYSCLQPD
jgi:hypothetical protein